MMDWEVNMVERRYRNKIFLSKIDEDVCVSASIKIASGNNAAIDKIIG